MECENLLSSIITFIALFDTIFVGMVGALALGLSEFYDMDDVLVSRKEFFRCVFQWELFVWEAPKEYVNVAGRIILVLLSTIFVMPFNITVFVMLSFFEFIRFLVWMFLKIFGKR